MGKNVTPAAKGSPSRIWVMKSSKEERSTPRRLRPIAERLRIAPQNFSRGFASVATINAPARKGPEFCVGELMRWPQGIVLLAGRECNWAEATLHCKNQQVSTLKVVGVLCGSVTPWWNRDNSASPKRL